VFLFSSQTFVIVVVYVYFCRLLVNLMWKWYNVSCGTQACWLLCRSDKPATTTA